ncbi:MAG: Nudix family hydrolase [Methylococcales bacterium]|nr:Nudix family hydrolase [Methylococcales bacterium]
MAVIKVVLGIIKNPTGQILISKRATNAHLGDLWEFSGGKVEQGESSLEALKRELLEEVGITVLKATSLIKIKHAYAELSVVLEVYTINNFSGVAVANENQPIKWVSLNSLNNYAFPEANKAIINAIKLPSEYAILDDFCLATLEPRLNTLLNRGIKLIQFRLKNLKAEKINAFLLKVIPLCEQYQAKILINSHVTHTKKIPNLGLHLTSHDLMALTKRPFNKGWVAASCHNLEQLKQAEKLGLDFAVLAPILPTLTHPDTKALGWDRMKKLIQHVNIPIFALGGMTQKDKKIAQELGAQGISGIRMFIDPNPASKVFTETT